MALKFSTGGEKHMSDETIELVRNFTTAIDNNQPDEYEPYLADTFHFEGWTPKPLDRQGFLDLISGLKAGIPGLAFNIHNMIDEDDTTVSATWHVTGYQSDSFVLPVLGTPPIPQTGRSISLPTEDVVYKLQDDKITAIHATTNDEGGVRGILKQLGIDLPLVQ
jgi:predicted ester cyclase